MSRCVVLDFNGQSVGEFTAKVDRNWALISPTVAGGGRSTISLPKKTMNREFLRIGNFIFIEQGALPPWVGMIDTPWVAKEPYQINAYNIEYILSQRYLDRPVSVDGTPFYIIKALVDVANAQEETYIRPRDCYTGSPAIVHGIFDQKDVWSQLKSFVQKNNVEVFFSAHHRERDQQLIIDMNVAKHTGVATGFELRDGPKGNMRVTSASLEGVIQNRIVGINKASTEAERIILAPMFDADSIARYRMRGGVYQFDTKNESQLENSVNTQLETSSHPKLKITIDVKDDGAFPYLGLGNSAWIHASRIRLPGGVVGWRGVMRMIVMAYGESNNTMSLALETPYIPEALSSEE